MPTDDKSIHLRFPIIYISKPGTLIEQLGPDKKVISSFFESLDGIRVLIIHGNQSGIFPYQSDVAIKSLSPERIYCCFPKSCRETTGDLRIVGAFDEKMFYTRTDIGKDQAVFTLKLKEN